SDIGGWMLLGTLVTLAVILGHRRKIPGKGCLNLYERTAGLLFHIPPPFPIHLKFGSPAPESSRLASRNKHEPPRAVLVDFIFRSSGSPIVAARKRKGKRRVSKYVQGDIASASGCRVCATAARKFLNFKSESGNKADVVGWELDPSRRRTVGERRGVIEMRFSYVFGRRARNAKCNSF
ncbi:hypothetical protein Trydic_g19320, partial [Trypoxylus dichotomus]